MLIVLHGEFSLALSHGSESCAVAKHLSKGNMCFYNNLISLSFTVLYHALAPIYVTNDGPLELIWGANLYQKLNVSIKKASTEPCCKIALQEWLD